RASVLVSPPRRTGRPDAQPWRAAPCRGHRPDDGDDDDASCRDRPARRATCRAARVRGHPTTNRRRPAHRQTAHPRPPAADRPPRSSQACPWLRQPAALDATSAKRRTAPLFRVSAMSVAPGRTVAKGGVTEADDRRWIKDLNRYQALRAATFYACYMRC